MIAAIPPQLHQACTKPTIAVAPREPYVTRGPTEILVGLYVQGGALIPGCQTTVRGPDGGTVTLRSPSGTVVARETLQASGRLFVLHVAPGTYMISGRLGGGGVILRGATVTLRKGHTVRQDLFEDVP